MFCLTPEGLRLLMFTPDGRWPASLADWSGILLTTGTSCLALVGLCIGATGYALRPANALERGLATLGGLSLLAADARADLLGIALLAAALALHWLRVRPQMAAGAPVRSPG